jgi:flavin-dependent dehydrogenase
VSYGIRRYEFDDWLQQQAGVEKHLGVKIKSIEKTSAGWRVNDQWQAPLLVGAGGHFCPVASHLGDGPGGHEKVVAAKELEVALTPEQAAACQVEENQPHLWFCRDLKGYAWVFRKGNYINIGLGREDNHQLTEHLMEFVHGLEQQGTIPVIEGHYNGHAYLLYDHARRPLVGDGIMLIGDAAGLAYTQSGEGIRPAIESALLASEVLATATDYSEGSLAAYARKMESRFGYRKEGSTADNDWFGLKTALARPLMRTRWFTREIVTKRWFLHQQLPALVV